MQLPRLRVSSVLPVKTEGITEDDLIISFNINEVGKAVNIERIQFPVVEAIRYRNGLLGAYVPRDLDRYSRMETGGKRDHYRGF